MRITRRALLAAPAILALRPAAAQDYPTRSIRMVVPYPPGGASDVIARLLAQPLSEMLGQTMIVENRVGANGAIAAELVVRSAPDGYTLLMGNAGPNALGQALLGRKLPYDSVADFSPIALVSEVPLIMGIHPAVPATDLQSLIALARARPGAINYATGGIGSAPHLTMEQLGSLAGVQWVNVAFRGGQLAMAAVLAGQIPILIDTAPVLLPQIREGKLRGIAVSTTNRIPQAPELPNIAEQGFPGFAATSWGGVLGPAALPAPIVARLNAAIVRAIAMPQVRDPMVRGGIVPLASTPAEFAAHIAAELRRWTEVVQVANIKPE